MITSRNSWYDEW